VIIKWKTKKRAHRRLV